MKKLIALSILGVMFITGTAWSSEPEYALSTQYEDSVYFVLRLEDTSKLLKWIFSSDNLKLFMPLILKGKSELEVAAASDFINAIVSMTPLRSAALVVGMNKRDVKDMTPVMQMAFTVNSEVSDIVKKIAEGNAEAIDVATLFIGSRIAAAFAETTIKVEKEKDNIYRVNNNIFMAASDDVVIFGSSVNNVRSSLKSLADEKSRLFTDKQRMFSEDDFALIHIDYETAAKLDSDKELEKLNASKYFVKPLEMEFAFKSLADKFLMSASSNLRTALAKEYSDEIFKHIASMKVVKGGNINLDNSGGKTSPLLAFGTQFNFEVLKNNEVWKPIISSIVRNLRVRFGITEQETADLFTGQLSAVVNGTVNFESFRLPAVYINQTGQEGAAGKVFERLSKSQFFAKVQDNVLQMDSSLSPISCFAVDKGETIGMYLAELTSFEDKPTLKPGLADLMDRESLASMWLDFAEIQSWLNDESNGVIATIGPLMTFGGYGEYFKALREILSAELSVPSVSFWSETPDAFHAEFAVQKIDAEKGLFAKIIKLYQELQAPKKSK